MTERTAVYRLYDGTGALLYVGISKNFGRRWQQHAYSKAWWPLVDSQTIHWHPTRSAAAKAEADAIRAEGPLHNIVCTPLHAKLAASRGVHKEPNLAAFGGPIVGATEIGALLGGTSRQRVQQLVSLADFPPPLARLLVGKIWDTEEVKTWIRDHRPAST